MAAFEAQIKYDAERDLSFPQQIKSSPGCELLDRCIQCGTCSGTCPFSTYMDLTPRRVIHLTRSGFKDDVLRSFTIWLCASCYSCAVECPKEIGITDIMYALKQRAIEEKVYPERFPIPVLAKEFLSMIRSKGRITESWLMAKLLLKTKFWKGFGLAGLGINLMRTGRFSLLQDSMEKPQELRKLLAAMENKNGGAKK